MVFVIDRLADRVPSVTSPTPPTRSGPRMRLLLRQIGGVSKLVFSVTRVNFTNEDRRYGLCVVVVRHGDESDRCSLMSC